MPPVAVEFGAVFNPTQLEQGTRRGQAALKGVAAEGEKTRASVGRLTAEQERFNASSRRTATAGLAAQNGIRELRTKIDSLNTARRAGRISAAEYNNQLLFLAGTAKQAGVSSARVVDVVGRQAIVFDKVAKSTTKARVGLGTIRSSMASVTARAVGLNGTLGSLAGGIGQFALGNLASIGVIAGIAAIGLGFRAMGKAAREAGEAAKGALAQAKSIRSDAVGPSGSAPLRIGIEALQSQIRNQRGRLGELAPNVTNLGIDTNRVAREGVQKSLDKNTAALTTLEAELKRLEDGARSSFVSAAARPFSAGLAGSSIGAGGIPDLQSGPGLQTGARGVRHLRRDPISSLVRDLPETLSMLDRQWAQLDRTMKKAGKATDAMGIAFVGVIGAMASALFSQRGGFVQKLGQFVGVASSIAAAAIAVSNPVGGAIAATVGGVVGGALQSAGTATPTPVSIENFSANALAQQVQATARAVSVLLVQATKNTDTRALRHNLARAQRLNAAELVPAGAF